MWPIRTSPRDLPDDALRADASVVNLESADAVVLLVDNTEFDLGVIGGSARYVFDCRDVLPGAGPVAQL